MEHPIWMVQKHFVCIGEIKNWWTFLWGRSSVFGDKKVEKVFFFKNFNFWSEEFQQFAPLVAYFAPKIIKSQKIQINYVKTCHKSKGLVRDLC